MKSQAIGKAPIANTTSPDRNYRNRGFRPPALLQVDGNGVAERLIPP
jgi:hypothetical protein